MADGRRIGKHRFGYNGAAHAHCPIIAIFCATMQNPRVMTDKCDNKTCKSKMAMTAIVKIVVSPYISSKHDKILMKCSLLK